MKPLEDIDPEDLRLFMDPEREAQVADGPSIFSQIFSHSAAPKLDFANWYIDRAVGFNNGAHHQKLRSHVSGLLAEKYDILGGDRQLAIEEKDVVSSASHINIVEDICVPLADQMINTYLSLPESTRPFLNDFNAIRFHRDLRIGRVKQLNGIVQAIHEATRACPERARYVDLIPTFLITRHTFIATVSLSIADCLVRNADRRLDTLTFPQLLTTTSLPYLARIAPKTLKGTARSYEAGQAYRCPISTKLETTGPLEIPSFGERPRQCLGRTMSFLLWRRTAEVLNQAMERRRENGQVHYVLRTPILIDEVGDHPLGGDVSFF